MNHEITVLYVPHGGRIPLIASLADSGKIDGFHEFECKASRTWAAHPGKMSLVLVSDEANNGNCKLILIQQYEIADIMLRTDGPRDPYMEVITEIGDNLISEYRNRSRN